MLKLSAETLNSKRTKKKCSMLIMSTQALVARAEKIVNGARRGKESTTGLRIEFDVFLRKNSDFPNRTLALKE